MRHRPRDTARRLRITVDRLPRHTKEAMLRGIETNRIIVGAYVDRDSGGICPMLAAHRNGGRTGVAAFARAWDDYTHAKRPRRASRREVNALRSLLERSLDLDADFERTPIAELAAQVRAERAALRRSADVAVPEPDAGAIRVRREPAGRDLLAVTERELVELPKPGPAAAARRP